MGEQDLINLLTENIAYQLRHPDYGRTLEVRHFATSRTTDEGQQDEVERYRRYEADSLKEQRNRLYNSFTGSIISSLRKNWKRLSRVEGIRETFEPESDALTKLRNDFYSFFPGESLNDWLSRMLEHFQVTDPNTWIVYERADMRNEEGQIILTKVYPFVVPCVDVLNFEYKYGYLQWFLCRTSEIENFVENGVRMSKVLETYFLYSPGKITRMREVGKNTIQEPNETAVLIEVYPTENEYSDSPSNYPKFVGSKPTKQFYLKQINNGTKEVPALVAGAYMDETTGHKTRVPWFMPGKGLLNDIIKLKSSLDVCLTVHTYPKRREFVKPCKFSTPELGECTRGYLNDIRDSEHRCPSCGGTGIEAGFTTEQESIYLFLPDDPALLLELSKLAFTEPVDVTLPELLQKLLDRRTEQFIQAIFSSDSHQKPDASGAKTAFEVARINEGVHDALTTYGKLYSQHVELAYRIGCQYREIPLTNVDHSFPEDLQIEMLDELIARFKAAKESGVGYEVVSSIRKRIQQKTFEGDPKAQKRIATRYYWMPFDDRSPEDVAMIIASRSPEDRDVVLYQNFKSIFQEIEEENPTFAEMAVPKQREILNKKVDEYVGRIKLIDAEVPEEPAMFPDEDKPNEKPMFPGNGEKGILEYDKPEAEAT